MSRNNSRQSTTAGTRALRFLRAVQCHMGENRLQQRWSALMCLHLSVILARVIFSDKDKFLRGMNHRISAQQISSLTGTERTESLVKCIKNSGYLKQNQSPQRDANPSGKLLTEVLGLDPVFIMQMLSAGAPSMSGEDRAPDVILHPPSRTICRGRN